MTSLEHLNQPDLDSIKMFVGQIPQSWTETELTELFEPFGPVHQIDILRDRTQTPAQSKGCCFVTFYTRKAALDAKNALHNITTLTGMNCPIQILTTVPFHCERTNPVDDRKLFIGMISKKYGETEVGRMFSAFGHIKECEVHRGQDGGSRGCAFITFSTREMAHNAIKAMHHSLIMEGCNSPIVCKLADTRRNREQQSQQQKTVVVQQMQLNSASTWDNLAGLSALGPEYLALLQQATSTSNQGSFSGIQMLGAGGATAAVLGGHSAGGAMNTLPSLGTPQSLTGGMGLGNLNTPLTGSGLSTMATMHGGLGASMANGSGSSSTDALTQAYSGMQQYTASALPSLYSQSLLQQHAAARSQEGPEGGKLFLYHLPRGFGDQDLQQLFMAFGNVVSAKVFIDKQTNLCFGFVSYDNAMSAQAAAHAMNGFQIGMRRLKVQLMCSKNDSKPY